MRHTLQSRRSAFLHLVILEGIALVLGVYLIVTSTLIAKDGVFYVGQARRVGTDLAVVARRYPPGYPMMLWAAHEAVSLLTSNDSTLSWIYSSQGVTLLCRLLALIPLYFLGKRLVGAGRSFLAVLVLIVLPYPAGYGSDVLREWPYVLFLGLGFWMLYAALQSRRWWLFGVVGLLAALGYLIRPSCGQLAIYALLGLVVVHGREHSPGTLKSILAALLLFGCLAAPLVPYVYAAGTIVPHQLRPSSHNAPPVIALVGGQAASQEPLEFEVGPGTPLELAIEAFDPDGDVLTFSVVGVPIASRPVYAFHSPTTGACFWTISSDERDSLLTDYSREVWAYDGIACYAYAHARDAAGLQPVCRFWSLAQRRHFYTMSLSEKATILEQSPREVWTYEGVVFHALTEGAARGPDTAAVYRLWSESKGYSWVVQDPEQDAVPTGGEDVEVDAVAWHVPVAGAPPTGISLADGVLRWQGGPHPPGDYQVNIIASDGELDSDQLVRIRVREAVSGSDARQAPSSSAAQNAGLGALPQAADQVVDSIGQSLMVFFLVPWCLGLFYRLRYKAHRLERALISAVVATNVGLMLARHVWIEPGSARRYSLGLIALTIFYIPTGLEMMAGGLGFVLARRRRVQPPDPDRGSPWLHVLIALGIAICIPKLVSPLRGDKQAYRHAALWLRENTEPGAVIATPDSRITFYAERRGLVYEQYPNWRKADYVVGIVGHRSPARIPDGLNEKYSAWIDRDKGRSLVIFESPRRAP